VSGARRPIAPEGIDEAVGRDDLAGVEHEEAEQRPLLPPRQRLDATLVERLDRPEDAELHLKAVSNSLPPRRPLPAY
jgi:hypothetical protein